MRWQTGTLIGAVVLFYFQPAKGVLPSYQRQITTPPVTDSAGSVPYPFLGGIDSPKDALVDVDNDGDFDLFLLRLDGQLNFFRNTGTPSIFNYMLEKQNLIDTSVGTWFRFADINGDGKKDLFCDNGAAGIRYYQNTTVNLSQTPTFSLNSSAFQGIFTEFNNIPAFVDIDNDADLDFFSGRQVGSLSFYRNDGTVFSPNLVHITDTYDNLSTLETAPPCTANTVSFPPPETFWRSRLESQTSSALQKNQSGHGANNIDFADIDADGDYDFFWGDINNINMYYFKNEGNSSASNLVKTSNCYLPIDNPGFNTPAFGDLDADGDKDMVVGAANIGIVRDNLIYLRNDGNASTANFTVVTKNFLRDIDVGGFAYPQLVDIDGDCDKDLITGSSVGRLFFFKNVGSVPNPVYQLVSTNFGGITLGGLSPVAIPTFADIDADGDFDLFLGKDNGTVSFYRNIGTPQSPLFSLITNKYLNLQFDTNPIFAFADIDRDVDLDLFTGEWKFTGSANVRFYRNEGTPQSDAFTFEISQVIPAATRIQTIPTLVDYDSDSDLDLFIGNHPQGTIQLFRNDGTPDTFSFTPVAGDYAGIDVGSWAAPIFPDIDGDGDYDLLVGTEEGGVFFYRNTAAVSLLKGDVNLDGILTSADVVALLNSTFLGFCFKAPFNAGDLNCDGILTGSDVVKILNLVFLGIPGGC